MFGSSGLFNQPSAQPTGGSAVATTTASAFESSFGGQSTGTMSAPPSTTSMFGSKSTNQGSSQTGGLFGGVGKGADEGGSLLRQLLSADSSTKATSQPTDKHTAAGFAFNGMFDICYQETLLFAQTTSPSSKKQH